MKVVILCGGYGTRLKEAAEFKPKPMVEIGGKPILWHIMKIYAHYGFNEFILCLGYQGEQIKRYFLDYNVINNDFTVSLGEKKNIKFHTNHVESQWKVTLVDTGEQAQTGARLKGIEKYITEDSFMLTYGDGVGNINIRKLLAFHRSHGKIGTVTGVRPSSRFGELILDGNKVQRFNEKPQTTFGYINGGFFVFRKEFFRYVTDNLDCRLEGKPLEQLVTDDQFHVYCHDGFWQCMDTKRELDSLVALWHESQAPWKIW